MSREQLKDGIWAILQIEFRHAYFVLYVNLKDFCSRGSCELMAAQATRRMLSGIMNLTAHSPIKICTSATGSCKDTVTVHFYKILK